MTTNQYQEAWFASAVGRKVDLDNGSYDCPDVPKDYAEHIWANTTWRQVWPGAGNANDMINTVDTSYFDVIWNDPNQPDQIPQRGDVIVWAGNNVNPAGHIAVVESADANGVTVIQEDSYLQVAMFEGTLGYWNSGTGMCSGWLRPKFDGSPVQSNTNATRKVTSSGGCNVRTAPNTSASLAPEYPDGLAQGDTLAVVGYVKGEEVTPGNNAWYKTISGYYVWTNNAEDDLTGLEYLGDMSPVVPPVTPPVTPPAFTGLTGIDASSRQENYDLSKVNCGFVAIKVSEGVDWYDTAVLTNVDEARRGNKRIIFYHYARPLAQSGNIPAAEADTFLRKIRLLLQPGDCVALDYEADHIEDFAWAEEWLTRVENGVDGWVKSWFYGYEEYLKTVPDSSPIKQRPLWWAQYPLPIQTDFSKATNTKPTLPFTWAEGAHIWQFTDGLDIEGFKGDGDLLFDPLALDRYGFKPNPPKTDPVLDFLAKVTDMRKAGQL